MTARGRPAARPPFAFQPQFALLQNRVSFMTASLPRLAVLVCLAVLAASPASSARTLRQAQANEPFPFGTELMLDAAPMRGPKRVPIIQIEDNGAASIDL